MDKEFNVYMDNSGRVVIPLELRKELDIHSKTRLVARVTNGELHLSTMKSAIKKAQAMVAKYCKGADLVEELFKMRKEEYEREIADEEKWSKND